jgi:5-methylcytosine-specific restriction protein A
VKGKCARHASEAEAKRNTRRARSLAVYRSARWRRLRARVLRERPWCEDEAGCREAATDVDHIIAIEDGGDPWDEDNLRPLCHPHHSRKTRTIDQARRAHR